MDEARKLTRDEWREAIEHADLRVLLMVLVHLTGDQTWLEPPFRPVKDVRLIPDPSAGLRPSVQQKIRSAAVEALSQYKKPVVVDPGDELMHRMMSVCLGENVAPEYAGLNREEMGLKDRSVHWTGKVPDSSQNVLIVGAGVCGIALAVSLKKLGVRFVIVERNEAVGGTWFLNRYPGCGVDTPNHSYSYSFGPRHRWSRYFSRREEVEAYIAKVVKEFDLEPHIRFATELKGSQWNEKEQCWVSALESRSRREVFTSTFLISAIGASRAMMRSRSS